MAKSDSDIQDVLEDTVSYLRDMLQLARDRVADEGLNSEVADLTSKVSNAMARVTSEVLKYRRAEHLRASKMTPEEKDEAVLAYLLSRPEPVMKRIIAALHTEIYGI